MDETSYQKIEKIGEGTYGVVYKAYALGRRDDVVALKKVRFSEDDDGVPATSLREISVLRELNHPNIVALRDVIYSPKCLHLVFEYLDQDLKHFLGHVIGPVPLPLVASYTRQLLAAVAYCHSHRILHRDIKPANLLIDQDGVLKLADFGLARSVGLPVRAYTHEVVTLWYRAPEILLGSQHYAMPVDVWSVGCILAELASKKPLFGGDSEIDTLYRMFRILGTPADPGDWRSSETAPGSLAIARAKFPVYGGVSLSLVCPTLPDDGLDLLAALVTGNPRKRVSAKEALLHSFVQPPYGESVVMNGDDEGDDALVTSTAAAAPAVDQGTDPMSEGSAESFAVVAPRKENQPPPAATATPTRPSAYAAPAVADGALPTMPEC